MDTTHIINDNCSAPYFDPLFIWLLFGAASSGIDFVVVVLMFALQLFSLQQKKTHKIITFRGYKVVSRSACVEVYVSVTLLLYDRVSSYHPVF